MNLNGFMINSFGFVQNYAGTLIQTKKPGSKKEVYRRYKWPCDYSIRDLYFLASDLEERLSFLKILETCFFTV